MAAVRSPRLLVALVVIAAVTVLGGCSGSPGSSIDGMDGVEGSTAGTVGAVDEVRPAPPDETVVGMGLVVDSGTDVMLCLGAVEQSAPPQCAGIPVHGWDWTDLLEYSETAGDARWDTFAVGGRYDGDAFALELRPTPWALYDPMAVENRCAVAGDASDDRLAAIEHELRARFGSDLLASSPQDGLLCVDVVWDDGTWQGVVDDAYGAGPVVVRSALSPLPEG